MVMREYNFSFKVICAGPGTADLARVEELIDMNMQDLLMEDLFVEALDEQEAVTIQVILVK
jgi:hypothetical protein